MKRSLFGAALALALSASGALATAPGMFSAFNIDWTGYTLPATPLAVALPSLTNVQPYCGTSAAGVAQQCASGVAGAPVLFNGAGGQPSAIDLTHATNLPNSATTATNANTPSTIVARDASGNFSAGTIAAALTGHASLDIPLAGGAVLPNLSASVEGTGTPGLDNGNWFLWNSGAFNATPTFRADRHVTSGTGIATNVYSAFISYGSNNPADAGYEWNYVGQFNNTSLVGTTSESGSGLFTTFKTRPTNTVATTATSGTGTTATVTFAGGATIRVGDTVLIAGMTPTGYNGKFVVTASSPGSVSFASATTGAQTIAGTIVDISVGASWGFDGNCTDLTGENNPVASCTNELDVDIQNPEGVATTDANVQRVGLQIAASGHVAGTHVGIGEEIASNPNTIVDRGHALTGAFGTGIDLTGTARAAGVSYSQSAILLNANVSNSDVAWLDTSGVFNPTTGHGFTIFAAGDNNWYFDNESNTATNFRGPTGAVRLALTSSSVSTPLSILSSGATAGVGYTTGAGGTVTQATSKATGVTLNKASGAITLNAAALASATIVSFTLTDSAIAATDVLVLNHISGGTPGAYTLNAQAAAGSATINVRNATGGSLSEAIVIQLAVIKGSVN